MNESIYSIEKYAGHNPMRDYFLPMAFDDPAVLHAFLYSAGAVILPPEGGHENSKSLMHLKECIRLVNDRLCASPPVLSDSTIAIVTTIAYDEVSKNVSPSYHSC